MDLLLKCQTHFFQLEVAFLEQRRCRGTGWITPSRYLHTPLWSTQCALKGAEIFPQISVALDHPLLLLSHHLPRCDSCCHQCACRIWHCKQQIPGQCVSKGDLGTRAVHHLHCCVKKVIFDKSKYQLSTWICVCEGQWERDAAYSWLVGWCHSCFSAEMFSLCKWKEDVSRKSICSALTCTPSGFRAISTPGFQLWGVKICSAKLSTSLPIFSHSLDGHFLWLAIALLFFKVNKCLKKCISLAFKWMCVLR